MAYNCYFDFENSFLKQTKKLQLGPKKFILRTYNDSMRSYFPTMDLQEESRSHSLGYVVGKTNGLNEAARHRLLKQIIDSSLMTISEIKNSIEFNINFNEGKPNVSYALKNWEDDLEYINRSC